MLTVLIAVGAACLVAFLVLAVAFLTRPAERDSERYWLARSLSAQLAWWEAQPPRT